MLHDSFLRVAPYSKVKSSFEAAGAVYEPSEKMPVPTVRFSLEFATHIQHRELTKIDKERIR